MSWLLEGVGVAGLAVAASMAEGQWLGVAVIGAYLLVIANLKGE